MFYSIKKKSLVAMCLYGALNSAVFPRAKADPASSPPGVSKQYFESLPHSQVLIRLNSVVAVNEELLRAAEVAEMAYSDNALTNGWERFQIAKTLNAGSEKFTVLMKVDDLTKVVEIAIRGTSNFDDVLTDLNSSAVRDPLLDVPLHSGFRGVALMLHSFLKEKLQEDTFKNYKFKIYGHSMGGAVAAILGMYLYQTGSSAPMVVTFGAPRFTTNEGARKYLVLNSNTYRVVRCDDVVPFLPPPNFFGWSKDSYEANGNILLLLKTPYFDYSINIDIERDFVTQLRTELNSLGKRDDLAYGHRMQNYSRTVRAMRGQILAQKGESLKPVSYNTSQQEKLCPNRF